MADYLKENSDGGLEVANTVSVGGVSNAGKIPALNASGLIDNSMLPAGSASSFPIVQSMPFAEAVPGGALINVFSDGGVAKVRNADAGSGKVAHGFVLAGVAVDMVGSVVLGSGLNTATSGLTAGAEYFLGNVGALISAPNLAAGVIAQPVGFALGADTLLFNPGIAIQN